MKKVQVGIRPAEAGGKIFEVQVRPEQVEAARQHLAALWATYLQMAPGRVADPMEDKGRIVELMRFYESAGAFQPDADEQAQRRVQDLATITAHVLDGGYWLIDLQAGRIEAIENA